VDAAFQIGVYSITNRANGKRYVGVTSIDFRVRWHQHRIDLRKGRHCNKGLQADWNKVGESSFEFAILEVCSAADCKSKEQAAIRDLNARNPNFGYNIGTTYHKCTPERAHATSVRFRAWWSDPNNREQYKINQTRRLALGRWIKRHLGMKPSTIDWEVAA